MLVEDLKNESKKKFDHLKELLLETRFKCENKDNNLNDIIDNIEFIHILTQSIKTEINRR